MKIVIKVPDPKRVGMPEGAGTIQFHIEQLNSSEHYVPLVAIEVEVNGKVLKHQLYYWTDKGRIVDGR